MRLLLTLSLLGACAGEIDSPDAGPRPTPGVCLAGPVGTGNALGVGAFCTPGGNECAATPKAKLCAIDLDPEGDQLCIKLGCEGHDDCGEGGCCTGRADAPIKACVPKGCLTDGDLLAACPPIPGADAGVTFDGGN